MVCNHCGNQVTEGSTYCNTCGNAFNAPQPTVVPQQQPTVVPQQQPTVVPQQSKNGTIIAVIIVTVLFIMGGVVGMLVLNSTKASFTEPTGSQQLVFNETSQMRTDVIETTRKTTVGWTTTTEAPVVHHEGNSYSVNGFNIYIPNEFTPSYVDGTLTIINNQTGEFFLLEIIPQNVNNIDPAAYKMEIEKGGYAVSYCNRTRVGEHDAIELEINDNKGHVFYTLLVNVTGGKVGVYMFDSTKSSKPRAHDLVLYSIGE